MKTNATNKIIKNKRSTFYVLRSVRGGFTLVEMMTVVAITTLMFAGMIVSSSRFGDSLLLTNISYDIASAVRQAQSYGLSTKNWLNTFNSSSPNQGFDRGYGIRFASVYGGSELGNKKFVMFYETDDTNDGIDNNNWHCGGTGQNPLTLSECKSSPEGKSIYFIPGRSVISKICAIGSSVNDCYDFTNSTGSIRYLDLIFKRADPDSPIQPDAHISTDRSIYPNSYQRVEITLLARAGSTFSKKIIITAIGQILVQ